MLEDIESRSSWRTALARLDTCAARLEGMPYPAFAALCLFAGAMKVGLAGVGPNFLTPLRQAAAALPEVTSSFSSSAGPVLLMRLLGLPASAGWWLVGGVLWLGLLFFLAVVASHLGAWSRPAVLVVAASPVVYLSASMIGHYDLWLISGSLLLVLGRRGPLILAGILVACLGNPQQAFVSAVALFGTALLLPGRPKMRRSAVFLGASVVSWAASEWWMASAGLASRSQLLDLPGVLIGVRLFAGSWPLTLYSFLGPLCILLVATVIWASARFRWAVAPATLIPFAATLVTLDMTRVFVATSTAALTLYLTTFWHLHWRAQEPPRWMLAVIVVLALVPPAVVVLPEPTSFVRLPFDEALTFFGWPIDWSLRR